MNYTLGAIPSPPDKRDFPLALLIPVKTEETFPLEYESLYMGSVKRQEVGSCVGQSLSYTREIAEETQTGEFKQFSAGFVYANRQEGDYNGEGMYPREALKSLKDFGITYQVDFPLELEYSYLKVELEKNKAALLEKAYPHRISAYSLLTTREEMKTAILTSGSVSATWELKQNFFAVQQDGIVRPENYDESSAYIGCHQMTIIGWKLIESKEYWIVINSWGDTWADKGKCYIPFYGFHPIESWATFDDIYPATGDFISMIKDGAIAAYHKYGIFPSITFAQAILESAWGKKAPRYNMFGIKWTTNCGYEKQMLPTWEYENGQWVKRELAFRAYKSYAESIDDHSKLLAKTRYAPVRASGDYIEACNALQYCGYATDPTYAKKLISLIVKYNLNEYDREGYKMYKDFNKVSDWAKPYVEEAKKLGLMTGSDGIFNPQGNLTREQAAKLVVELYKKLK